VVVDCPHPTQVRRVMARSGWTEEAVQRVIAQQATRAYRRGMADAVIYNGDAMPLEGLRTAARTLWQAWTRAPLTPVEQ
ncbi:MAG: dephospho-CoA kinase, partial [Rhodoferax sp.]|nr:dephospho-CoA kinase [Rhodoferax sp.]